MGDYNIRLAESAFIYRVLNYALRKFNKTLWNDELEAVWQEGPQITLLSQHLTLKKRRKRKMSSK